MMFLVPFFWRMKIQRRYKIVKITKYFRLICDFCEEIIEYFALQPFTFSLWYKCSQLRREKLFHPNQKFAKLARLSLEGIYLFPLYLGAIFERSQTIGPCKLVVIFPFLWYCFFLFFFSVELFKSLSCHSFIFKTLLFVLELIFLGFWRLLKRSHECLRERVS